MDIKHHFLYIIMELITFCIPFCGTNSHHVVILETCIKRIQLFYPNNTIFVCKTSESLMPDLSTYSNVHIFNTFKDNSHILGAIELLIRECKTDNYIICHDSMFLLKSLPDDVLIKKYYSLWNFNNIKYCELDEIINKLHDTTLTSGEIQNLADLYETSFSTGWSGIFGPAFGGHTTVLREVWTVANIGLHNIDKYIGRNGIHLCERYLALLFTHLGCDTINSLNGNIFNQPKLFHGAMDIPDFSTIEYPSSYFYKIWQFRD